jgi:predicted transcriptional regulator
MRKELDEVKRRVLTELSREPASTIWKLCNVLGLSHPEVSDVLEELSKKGLVMVTPRGWELTVEAQTVLEELEEDVKGIRHSKTMTKVPLPSDVERAKSVIKPFKKESEEKQETEKQAN